jgi:hypothetical protein
LSPRSAAACEARCRSPRSAADAARAPQLERRRIGRGPKGNAVCVKDPSVSQKHAEVVWSGVAWTLLDVGSSNGSALNDVEVSREGARWRARCAACCVP